MHACLLVCCAHADSAHKLPAGILCFAVCCCCVAMCRVERAVAAGSSGSEGKDDPDPALSTAIADLHKFSMMQSMYKSAVHLLEDLSSHSKLLHMPERAQVGKHAHMDAVSLVVEAARCRWRHTCCWHGICLVLLCLCSVLAWCCLAGRLCAAALCIESKCHALISSCCVLLQVLLAAAQNPLLGEHHFAKALLPRLCSIILSAHKATRHVSLSVCSSAEHHLAVRASQLIPARQGRLHAASVAARHSTPAMFIVDT
jgi:hypothetical protein